MIEVELRYTGNLADHNRLDFYDASQALMGLQRSLAIFTHLALNGEVITQAPSLKGAQIITEAPREGSFRSKAWIVIGGMFAMGSVGKDSPVRDANAERSVKLLASIRLAAWVAALALVVLILKVG